MDWDRKRRELLRGARKPEKSWYQREAESVFRRKKRTPAEWAQLRKARAELKEAKAAEALKRAEKRKAWEAKKHHEKLQILVSEEMRSVAKFEQALKEAENVIYSTSSNVSEEKREKERWVAARLRQKIRGGYKRIEEIKKRAAKFPL